MTVTPVANCPKACRRLDFSIIRISGQMGIKLASWLSI
jgi:hypothetical protein